MFWYIKNTDKENDLKAKLFLFLLLPKGQGEDGTTDILQHNSFRFIDNCMIPQWIIIEIAVLLYYHWAAT